MCEEMPEAVRFWPGFDVTGPGCQIHSSTKYEDSSASVGTEFWPLPGEFHRGKKGQKGLSDIQA